MNKSPFTLDDSSITPLKLVYAMVTGVIKMPLIVLISLSVSLLCHISEVRSTCFNIFVKWYIVYSARIILFLLSFYKINVKGVRDPSAKIIVVGPHSSFIDGFCMIYLLQMPRFVAKHVDNIIVGPIIRFMKTILVIRESKESRLDTLNKLTSELSHNDTSGIVIFPEGTCTNRTSLIEFRKGAFTPGIPVQPVIIRTNCVPWVYSSRFHYAIVPFFVFCNVINELEIEFLPLYKPDIEEKKFPLIYASNVRGLMSRELNG